MRKLAILVTISGSVLIGAVLVMVGLAANSTGAADHLDAPFVQRDGRIDINDVFVFHPGAPQDHSRTVLVMTVDPVAGALSPTTFHPEALYELKIDTDGDARADVSYRIEFDGSGPTQDVTLRCVPAARCGNPGAVLAQGQTGSTIPVSGGGSLFAGLRDDPFFFDLVAFQNSLAFGPGGVGSDFFLGPNVTAIVLEVPTSALGPNANIGVWATTSLPGLKQVERMGRPVINTVLISSSNKDAFNVGKPVHDQRDFRSDVVNTLLALGNSAGTANALADVLLPDILTVDTSLDTGYLNGRNLADDVIDASLALVSGGAITTDCVDNDSAFLSVFPYLAVPN